MKFPQTHLSKRSLAFPSLVLLALTAAMTLTVVAQKSRGLAPEAAAASLEQCRNGTASSPVACTGSAWSTGNAGNSNSHWQEGQFNSYRMLFSDVTPGSNTVVIGFDFLHSGLHAFDYLGTYNYTNAGDPCSGVTGCAGWATSTAPAPTEPLLAAHVPPITQIPGVFTFFGATINGTPAYVPCASGNPDHRCVQIDFSPHVGVTDPVLAWGGHIAWRGDWGVGQSASDINGSPYHMRLIDLNGSGGNQDRSLNANAVFGSGSLRIVKSVTTFTLGTASTVQFFFNVTPNFGTSNFFLVDDDAGPGDPDILSVPVTVEMVLSGNNIFTFTEDISMFPANQNWSYNGTVCVESYSTAGTVDVPNGKTVHVDEGEVVVCTVSNTQLSPSAAPASVSGRAIDSFGNGIGGARIDMTDAQNGNTWSVITSPFGYYNIEGPEVGNFYIMTISHKRYSFAENTRAFTLNEDLVDIDWVANP